MAQTQIVNKCLKCNMDLHPNERVVYVCGVDLVNYGIRDTWYDSGDPHSVRPGKLRIKHVTSVKPRGAFHRACWNDLMVSIPRLMIKIDELRKEVTV